MKNLKSNKLKFKFQKGGSFNTSYPKYQLGNQFVSSDNIIIPDVVKGTPTILTQPNTANWKAGYLAKQTGNISADRCYVIQQGKRVQVSCDSNQANVITIPAGMSKKGEDEIFKREETKLGTQFLVKEGSLPTNWSKDGDYKESSDKFKSTPSKTGTGQHFKDQDCKCTPDSPSEEITIDQLKAKLSSLPNSASYTKKWALNLIKAGEDKGANGATPIKLVYAKTIKGETGTLDLGLQYGCMCGGSGVVTNKIVTDPDKGTEPGTDPEYDKVDETKTTKVIKGDYGSDNPNKKKQPKGIVKFGITVNLKGLKAPNGNDLGDMRQGVWYKGELTRDGQGSATGLKWSGPFTTMPQGVEGEEVLDIGTAKGQSRSQFVNGLSEAQGGVFNIDNAFSKPTFSSVEERDKLVTEAINSKLSLDILNATALENYVKEVRKEWFMGDGGYGVEKVTVQTKKNGGTLKFQRFSSDSKLSYLFQK